MTESGLPPFLADVVRQLRRRRVQVGIDDCHALRCALAAGFGLSSTQELIDLCIALWAKSPIEAQIVRAVFARVAVPEWTLPTDDVQSISSQRAAAPSLRGRHESVEPVDGGGNLGSEIPRVKSIRGLSAVPPVTGTLDRSLILTPQYPVAAREVAQALRRLRRPVRAGPAVELDVTATVDQRSRLGIATPPVVVPRRRNTARLLLMIDRHGSMTPFHGYVDHVVSSIRDAGRVDDVLQVYFHDVPNENSDWSPLEKIADPFRPDLDAVLPLIRPMAEGRVYKDSDLTLPRSFDAVLEHLKLNSIVLIISDGGAARRHFDVGRLLDTVALIKMIVASGAVVSWLNPLPKVVWKRSTAGQLARYIPMYPLTKQGLDQAIDIARGRPGQVEHPL